MYDKGILDKSKLVLRNATVEEKGKIYSLYQSAKGKGFCVWDEEYPGMNEINHDLETKNLYVLDFGGEIIGAVSVMPEKELNGFSFWNINDGTEKEIARIVVAQEYRGMGLAHEMVQGIAGVLREKGAKAIHLSVAKSNIPAFKTYMKAGFTVAGEAELYGGHYYLVEKII